MRKRDFNRLVKQARKAGVWSPVGCVEALVKVAEKKKERGCAGDISKRDPSEGYASYGGKGIDT